MKKLSLHARILLSMAIGLGLGLIMDQWGDPESAGFLRAIWWLDLIGKDIFVGALKMIIAPLIFASIVAGIYSLPNARELGNVGLKTLLYYFTTTAVAVAIGVAVVVTITTMAQFRTSNSITDQPSKSELREAHRQE